MAGQLAQVALDVAEFGTHSGLLGVGDRARRARPEFHVDEKDTDLTHLTHVYTKLGLTSRVQLVQEAARHT
jgi:hypothetical protein